MIGVSTPLADNVAFELRASGWKSALLAPEDMCRASFAFSAWPLFVGAPGLGHGVEGISFLCRLA